MAPTDVIPPEFRGWWRIIETDRWASGRIDVFRWEGAWEYDPMSGSGSVRLATNGQLRGTLRIKDGDSSSFVAVRADEPAERIPDPPS